MIGEVKIKNEGRIDEEIDEGSLRCFTSTCFGHLRGPLSAVRVKTTDARCRSVRVTVSDTTRSPQPRSREGVTWDILVSFYRTTDFFGRSADPGTATPSCRSVTQLTC